MEHMTAGFVRLVGQLVKVTLFKLLRLVYCPTQRLYWQLNGTARRMRDARDPVNYERSAQVLDIVIVCKFCELQNTVFEDYLCTHSRFENPQFILDNDDVSLLCVNDQNAIFVQAEEKGEFDNLQVERPLHICVQFKLAVAINFRYNKEHNIV